MSPGHLNIVGQWPLKQGAIDKNMKRKTTISWDNVPLNATYVGHLEMLVSNGAKTQPWQTTIQDYFIYIFFSC